MNIKHGMIKEQQQDEMWKRIKDKRYDNLRHGVFVKSVGKWFHTNDESRTQYILLRTMKELPVGVTLENDGKRFRPHDPRATG